ncbi:MAG: helicase-exonuclease AddAB subunit AddA [Clostridiales bacterium]|nr:helicase-exonuclease AddAB subunit AddA [Clostridiales bacterium]
MAKLRWTQEQQKAIDTKGCNLLVSAAAGAGKTAVLVERIIKMITDEENPVDIDRLLVVTFTNAAASEMREKIGNALEKKIEEMPDSKRLQRQIALISNANIMTVHSFCLEVIRNNFHKIDLDPAFKVADSTECVLLKQEVLDEMFDERYERVPSDFEFLSLVDCYGGSKGDSKLMDMVLRLYEFSQSQPYPKEWLYDAAEMFNVDDGFDFGSSPWAGIIKDDFLIELDGICKNMENAEKLLNNDRELGPYLDVVSYELENIKRIIRCCGSSWDSFVKEVSAFDFKKLPPIRKGSADIKEEVKGIRKAAREEINGIKTMLKSTGRGDIGSKMQKLYPLMKSFAGLASEFGIRYREKKKAKGIIDFDDIEHFAIDILTEKRDGRVVPSDAALKYREKFEEVLIDEYQDSNMVQELILSMVSKKDSDAPNLFMVGDVKQSIYRFRQAKPELFLQKYNTYKDTGKNRKILLNKNFRSRKEILSAVNYIFECIMSENVGEIDYNENEMLNPGAEYKELDDKEGTCGGPVEVHIIETEKSGEDTPNADDEEDIDGIQLEARMVSKRINELVGSNFVIFDKDEDRYRNVEYRDIVVLMRSTAYSAPVFLDEMNQRGIPAYSDGGGGYFEVAEVQTIISLLQIIDNPMQDIPLLSVLRSPIQAFNADELIDIRNADNRRTFYEALKAKSEMNDGPLSDKVRIFLGRLDKWRDLSSRMPISEFIWYLYTDTGYFAYAGAMPAGEQRQANLRILFERARQFEETSFKGLFNFINFINKLKVSRGDMGSAKVLGENENVVRIMSIHKSKGLEYPVVFVCGLGRKFNTRDLNESILFHQDLGFGPDFVDPEIRLSYPTIIKHAIRKKMKLENYSEEMRILYVAFTRAKEKLIITGTVGNYEKAHARWSEGVDYPGNKVPTYQVLKGTNFFDWICPALLKNSLVKALKGTDRIEVAIPGLCGEKSKWSIKLWKREEAIKVNEGAMENVAAGTDELQEGQYYGEVSRRLGFEYPFGISSKLPAKLSVTELKDMFISSMEDEYTRNIFVPPLIKNPAFMEDKKKASASERGTIMHLVMQHMDIDHIPTIDDVHRKMDKMVDSELMTEEQASYVDAERIVHFFQTSLGQRMVKSGKVYRETPFYIKVKSTEIYNDLPKEYEDEYIIVQGIIDCYFEEDNSLVLIDYKTDYVPEGGMNNIKDRYSVQIEYYKKALGRLTGKTVKEKYIYLFYNGNIIEF